MSECEDFVGPTWADGSGGMHRPYLNSAGEDGESVHERLEAMVRVLAEMIGPRTLQASVSPNAAADFITRSFESFGYPVMFHSYKVQGVIVRNIIAE